MRLIQYFWMMLCVALLLSYQGMSLESQSPDNTVIVFTHQDTLYAMPLNTGDAVTVGDANTIDLSQFLTDSRNQFTIESSPLLESPADGFGYYQGVFSADENHFAYTVIAPDTAQYRVISQETIVIESDISPERGYLIPIGWRASGELILLERYTLYSLDEVRVWLYSDATEALTLYSTFAIPSLSGNHAILSDGTVFIGFDTVRAQGYTIDVEQNQLVIFPTTFTLENPPRSVFDTYPMDVLAIITQADFVTWHETLPQTTANNDDPQAPFLYWMLPDSARNITCYMDSAWTEAHFAVECPGLLEPRAYEGHQGTDVGGLPNGLPLGTSVYASAHGLVLKTFTTCPRFDASCGDAYGNHLLMQHTLVNNGEIEVWFTGYAHLQTPLAEPYSYIENLAIPIALSGDTGLGGAHLHLEVRSLSAWVNPFSDSDSLWIGSNEHPISAQTAFTPQIERVCQSATDNNVRNGPGTSYDVIAKTQSTSTYNVIQTVSVNDAFAGGDWYQIQLEDGNRTGWLWAELAQECRDVSP